ncbi:MULTISPECIES: sensor histidine kinase [unclassified Streptomyces]|uniref:sensor histidine kinase n=1 Tax=unclassified Streptomyces TaxID=2593676 RepID=UPI0037F8BBE4
MIRRLVGGTVVLALVLTWVADLALLSRSGSPWHPATNWVPALVTGPVAVLALIDTPWSPPLQARAAAMAVLSVAVTGWCLAAPQYQASVGALEGSGLLFLLVCTLSEINRPTRTALVSAGLAAAVLLMALRHRSVGTFVPATYILTVALALCVALGFVIRAMETRRRRAVEDVRQAERLSLARDLHDLIAHHMTGIIVQANAAATIHATAPEKIEPILRTIAASGTETLESMRRLVRVLREDGHPAPLPGDLLGELAGLVARYCATAVSGAPADQARLEATATARTARLDPEVEISVHRLVQEALTNTRRHAPRARVTVQLDADDTWLHVSVVNTASPGHDSAPAGGRSGFGLIGLQERVRALDGTFHAGPLPYGGWQVQADFPRKG